MYMFRTHSHACMCAMCVMVSMGTHVCGQMCVCVFVCVCACVRECMHGALDVMALGGTKTAYVHLHVCAFACVCVLLMQSYSQTSTVQ